MILGCLVASDLRMAVTTVGFGFGFVCGLGHGMGWQRRGRGRGRQLNGNTLIRRTH